MRDHLGFTGSGAFVLTHHSPTCSVVMYPQAGRTHVDERANCNCGAFKGMWSRDRISFRNIVTTKGSEFYMEQITNGSYTTASPTVASVANDFGIMELANAGVGIIAAPAVGNDRATMSSIISGSDVAATTNYPRVSDPDGDNTGAGANVLTWQFFYSAASFSETGISDAWITNVSPGASEDIACHIDETTFDPTGTFDKTSSDTLKVIYNVSGAAPSP